MQVIDLKIIYENLAAQERNEQAEAARLRKARRNLKRELDRIEYEEEV